METTHSANFLRQRKMALVLPVLILPFITLAFWSMGGGQLPKNAGATTHTGLNLQLPDAMLKENKDADKLSFYNDADADAIKRQESMRNDPYYKSDSSVGSLSTDPVTKHTSGSTDVRHRYSDLSDTKTADVQEQQIYQKINELNQQITQPDVSNQSNKISSKKATVQENNQQFSGEVDRLQSMMEQMTGKPESDPEMEKLNGTLEKILDIQHPERIREKLKSESIKNITQVYAVSTQAFKNNLSLLDTGRVVENKENGFYSLEPAESEAAQNSIEAVVHETQTLVNGAVIKMRLLNDVYISGVLIPKDNFIFGIAALDEERLKVEITTMRYKQSLFPVKLSVFDLDGLEGIYIPGAISRDVAKQSADNSLQIMELSSMDPSLKAQATAGGISAVKSLLSKKIKLIKVQVKAGFKILLKDQSMQQ